MNKVSKVFVAYSHDSDEHKNWVANFSRELRSYGINVVLDQWDLEYGDDVTLFIESNIRDAKKVLIICTDKYIEKTNTPQGGAGYERMIVSRELIQNASSNKFIPIIRQSSGQTLTPDFMGVRFYADFRDDSRFEVEVEKLASHFGVKVSSDKSIEKMSRRNLKKLRKDLITQGGLFDFNIRYSIRHFNTLNRLIVDTNKYEGLNIFFDHKVPYSYESSVHRSVNAALGGGLFSLPADDFCAIYEFIYKNLSDDFISAGSNYFDELQIMINNASSREVFDCLLKFKRILELFENRIVACQNIVSVDFPDGQYDDYTLAFVRNKKQLLSAILTKYYD